MKGVAWPYTRTSPESTVPATVEGWLKKWNPGTDLDGEWDEWIEDVKDGKKNIAEYKSKFAGSKDESARETYRDELSKWQATYDTSLAACKGLERNARFVIQAQKAVKQERTGKYSVLSKEQILRMIGALWEISGGTEFHAMSKFAMTTWIEKPEDILKLALEYYFPSNAFAKEPGFTRTAPEHVFLNGHGFHIKGDEEMKVPAGSYLYFYTGSGDVLAMSDSKKIEGDTGDHVLAIPYDVYTPGSSVPNYYLAYPGGLFNSLEINVKGHKKGIDDLIVNRDPYRMVPLSALLERPRCKQATHIHWCACREQVKPEFLKQKGLERKKVGGHPFLEIPTEKRDPAKLKPGYALSGAGKTAITYKSE